MIEAEPTFFHVYHKKFIFATVDYCMQVFNGLQALSKFYVSVHPLIYGESLTDTVYRRK
jgi:hypothetical protein